MVLVGDVWLVNAHHIISNPILIPKFFEIEVYSETSNC